MQTENQTATATTEQIEITLPSAHLKALTLFCSDPGDVRPRLEGVYFDHKGKDLIAVATDGRAMATLNLGPNETLKGQCRFVPAPLLKRVKASSAEATIRQETRLGDFILEIDDTKGKMNQRYSCPLGDESFADWRVAFSTNLGPVTAWSSLGVDGDYLCTFAQAAKLICGKPTLSIRSHGFQYSDSNREATKPPTPNALSITINEASRFFGCLMPLRMNGEIDFPIPTFETL